MNGLDAWIFERRPLPHMRLRLPAANSVVVVATVGDETGKPDLGYGADDSASSPRDRRALAEAMGVEAGRLVFMQQVHGNRVTEVDASQAGAGLGARGSAIARTDALVTRDGGLALVGLSADCPLVALWDDGGRWAALAHAGWRGLAAGILDNVVSELSARGVAPGQLRAATGPHIERCCYEVGEDVVRALLERGRAAQEHFTRTSDYRTYLDLGEVIGYQLAMAGVGADRLLRCALCTCCQAKMLHSYRRDGPAAGAGRQAMAVRLRGP